VKKDFGYFGLDAEMFGLFAAQNRLVEGFRTHQFLGYPSVHERGVSLN
jgi:hypothetical protein